MVTYFYAEIIIVAFPTQKIMNTELTMNQDSTVVTSNHPALGTEWKTGRIKGEIPLIHHIAKVEAHLLLLLFCFWLFLNGV
jgi:hypothetical protein